MPALAFPLAAARDLLVEAVGVWLRLLKVLVPALLVVEALDALGAVDALGALLSPLTGALGLPDWAGVVWAATLLTNLFTGMALLFGFIEAGAVPSVAEMSTLGALMLIGHSLPVEGAVARRAGVPWSVTIALRVGGALVFAALVHGAYSVLGLGEAPARIAWRPEVPDEGALGWVVALLGTLATVFLIILALMALLRVLRALGVERLVHLALVPVLRALGIGPTAANVTVIGVVLGLTYGAGLVIRDVDEGRVDRRDAVLVLCFLGLLHAVIEDTLLIAALGADLVAILWARVAFSIAVVAVLARCLPARAFAPPGEGAAGHRAREDGPRGGASG